jgi:hypothetical protein
MRDSVNKKGHTETLVAAHPGNRNAVRSGVYSPATRAPRVQELEAEIRERPAKEVITEVLQREIANLITLAEAMDESLLAGCVDRRGEPRTLIDRRLRLNDRLRRTLEQYASAVGLRLVAEGDIQIESLPVLDAQISALSDEIQRRERDQGRS